MIFTQALNPIGYDGFWSYFEVFAIDHDHSLVVVVLASPQSHLWLLLVLMLYDARKKQILGGHLKLIFELLVILPSLILFILQMVESLSDLAHWGSCIGVYIFSELLLPALALTDTHFSPGEERNIHFISFNGITELLNGSVLLEHLLSLVF